MDLLLHACLNGRVPAPPNKRFLIILMKRITTLGVLIPAAMLWVLAWTADARDPRVWTSRSGTQIEAEWVGDRDGTVTLRKFDGKLVRIGLSSLSDIDVAYVKSLHRTTSAPATSSPPASASSASTPAAPAPAASRMSLGGVDVAPGILITFLAPLPSNAVRALHKEHNTIVTQARVGVAVPPNFDPAKPQRVFVVSATSDGNSMSIEHLKQYMKEALARGWVLMAADPPNGEEPTDVSNTWRWSLIRAGLDEMHRAWPGSRTWSYAAGGFSGGAKRSGYIAALLAKADYRVIGMYMGGCNEDMATQGLNEYQPKRSAFQRVPIFLSSGTRDSTATPDATVRVKDSMRNMGFRYVRIESYPGGHDPYPPHTDLALAWFDEIAAAH